jgi:hypothetical protein
MKQFTEQLVCFGLAYRSAYSSWARPVHIVNKPGPARYRFTVDLRPGKARQKQLAWPTPHLECQLASLAGSTCFATFDLGQGYWQLPLDQSSQEFQSFTTHDGIFTPTRVLRGNSNSVAYLQ